MKVESGQGEGVKITYKYICPSMTLHAAGPPVGLDGFSALSNNKVAGGSSRCTLAPKTPGSHWDGMALPGDRPRPGDICFFLLQRG